TLPSGHTAIAVPILISGQVVALIYSDDVGDEQLPLGDAWPQGVELLARHAARSLELLTAVRTAQALTGSASPQGIPSPRSSPAYPAPARPAPVETYSTYGSVTAVMSPPDAAPMAASDDQARRFARSALTDLKSYNEAAVMIGRQKRDLLRRLRPELDQLRAQ